MSRPLTAAFVVALATVATGCGGGETGESAVTTESTTAAVEKIDVIEAGATEIKLDGDWLVSTGDAIWVSAGPEMILLDPESGEEIDTVDVPGGPCLGGVYEFGALFEPTCVNDEGLVRIDPKTRKVTDSISLPTPDLHNLEGTVAAGEGAVWLVIDGKGCEACVLAGFDPDTLEMTHEVELDQGADSVAVGNGLIWVSDPEKNRIIRVDPKTDKVVGETKVGGLPRYIAFDDETGLWVLNQIEGNVMQLDPDSGDVIKTVEADVTGAGGSITVSDGSVWVRGTLVLLKQINPATGEVIAEYGPELGGGDALVEDGVLWLSTFEPGHVGNGNQGGGAVYRLEL